MKNTTNMNYHELVERERIWDQGFNEGMYYAVTLIRRRDAPEPVNPFRAERRKEEQ